MNGVVVTTSPIAHVCAQVRIQRQDDILYSAHNNYYLQQDYQRGMQFILYFTTVMKKERELNLKNILQCETLLGLDRKSTKKRRNKKFGECIPTIRCNVMNMYS